MKFLALALAASASIAAAADCDMGVLGKLVSDPFLKTCSDDSGYTFVPPAAAPTDDQMAKMCASANCKGFLTNVLAANPEECTVPLGGRIQLRADLLDKVTNYCKSHTASLDSATCDLATLGKLVGNPNQQPCANDSGYTFVPPAAAPTEAQMAKMCASANCQHFLKDVLAANPEECTVPVGGNIQLRADLLDKVTNFCQSHA